MSIPGLQAVCCLPVKIPGDRLQANQGAQKGLQLFLPAGLEWARPDSPQALGIAAVLKHVGLGLQRDSSHAQC